MLSGTRIDARKPKKWDDDTVAAWCHQWYIPSSAGVPNSECAYQLSKSGNSKIAASARLMLPELECGARLADVLHHTGIPSDVSVMLDQAERNGKLTEMLKIMETYHAERWNVQKRVLRGLHECMLTCFAMCVIMWVLLTLIIPVFVNAWSTMGAGVPAFMHVMQYFGMVLSPWYLPVILLVGLVALLVETGVRKSLKQSMSVKVGCMLMCLAYGAERGMQTEDVLNQAGEALHVDPEVIQSLTRSLVDQQTEHGMLTDEQAYMMRLGSQYGRLHEEAMKISGTLLSDGVAKWDKRVTTISAMSVYVTSVVAMATMLGLMVPMIGMVM